MGISKRFPLHIYDNKKTDNQLRVGKRMSGMRRGAALLLALLLVLSASGCSVRERTQQAFLLNTIVRITLWGADDATFNECFAIIRAGEAEMSRTDPESELAKLNARQIDRVSAGTAEVISAALALAERTGGAFDPTVGALCALWNFSAKEPCVPEAEKISAALKNVGYASVRVAKNEVSFADAGTMLDLGAIAKGEIADRVAAYLRSQGVERAILNLGGNVTVLGGETSYRVGVQDPSAPSGTSLLTLSVSDATVVTSGIYERGFHEGGVYYHHILDPRTGYPCDNELASVTVIGPSSASRDCDALSTACMLLGAEEGRALAAELGFDVIFILRNGEVLFTDGAEEKYDIHMTKMGIIEREG